MTSTSIPSLSDKIPDAFSVAGGGSIAAIFFLFLLAKKLPKNPPFSGFGSRLWGFGESLPPGSGFPVFGSTCTGFAAVCFSFTIAIAFERLG